MSFVISKFGLLQKFPQANSNFRITISCCRIKNCRTFLKVVSQFILHVSFSLIISNLHRSLLL